MCTVSSTEPILVRVLNAKSGTSANLGQMPQLMVISQLLLQSPDSSSSSLSLSLSPFLPSSPLFSPVSPAPSLPCSLVNILCKDLGPNRSRNVLVARWKPITLETILYKALLSNRNMQSHIQNFTFLISHNKKVQKEQIEIVLVIYFCLPRYIQNIISMGNQYKKHINEIFSFLFSHKMLKI